MNRCQTNALLERLEHGSCTGKQFYFSQREADDKAALSSFYSGEELGGYHCPFCLLFHIGHPKGGKRRKLERKLKAAGVQIGIKRIDSSVSTIPESTDQPLTTKASNIQRKD